jgi:hypothetical protein
MSKIAFGYCQCGCGQKTKICSGTCYVKGKECIKGEPRRFVYGHAQTGLKDKSLNWRGGKNINSKGYVEIYQNKKSYILEHIFIAEKALGKPLPPKAVVHHVDENKTNNFPNNLVICQNNIYHKLLHKRLRALNICGHADWEICQFCKKYDDPKNLIHTKDKHKYHNSCRQNNYRMKRKQKNIIKLGG